ncbi:TPA: hypothetical protein ACJJYZ_004624, partial [Enterobacter hormaechei subsp. xiangfangensis]
VSKVNELLNFVNRSSIWEQFSSCMGQAYNTKSTWRYGNVQASFLTSSAQSLLRRNRFYSHGASLRYGRARVFRLLRAWLFLALHTPLWINLNNKSTTNWNVILMKYQNPNK